MDTRIEQLIESYFANRLSEAEAQELRRSLAKDPEVAAHFAWQQSLASQVKSFSLGDSIQNTTWRQAAKPPFRSVTMWRKSMAAAAAIVVLLVASWFILRPGPTERLLAANFRYYPNKLPFKSLGASDDPNQQVSPAVQQAFEVYDDSTRYDESAKLLGPVVSAHPDRLDYRFYYGVALLGDRQYAAAVTALQPIAGSEDIYRIPALYYLGLAYVGTGDKMQARKYLEEYAELEEDNPFKKQAQNVLEALR